MSAFDVRKYRVTVKHDHGKAGIITTASTADTAARIVCSAEYAPRSAVISIKDLGSVLTGK